MCYGFDVKLWHAICGYSVFELIDFLTFLCMWFELIRALLSAFTIILIDSLLDLGSSFWGMALILASTNLLTARIAAGCFIAALIVVLFLAKNVRLNIDRVVLYQIYETYFCPDFSPFSCLFTHFYSKSGHFEDYVLVSSFVIFIFSHRMWKYGKMPLTFFFSILISGFIVFIAVIWVLQEKTTVHVLRYVILFIGMFLFFHFPKLIWTK